MKNLGLSAIVGIVIFACPLRAFAIDPTASVTAPASGSVFGGPAPYTVEGTASDTDGTVVSVRIAIENGTEYWDPSTETWVGSSTWVTSAYLTNGGDWATWSYAWNRPSHDSASVSITVEATDNDGNAWRDTVAATLDSQAPVVSSGVSFDFLPVSGLSAGIDLSSSWSDAHTGTPEFQYTLNGAASGWSDSDAGASEFATKSYPGLPALDGNDLFDSIESRHTDAAGNGPTSSTAGPIYVQPMAPAASTVDNATPTTLDVTINETESGLGILYAIEVDGFQYVQAGGALGGSPVWQTLAAWGSPITLTGLSPETFYLFRTFAGNPSDGTPTPAENSQSTGFGSSSGITTSVIPPSVSVTAPASGSVFGGPAPYTVEGTASDSDGTVVSVRVQIVKGAEYWDPSTETWVGSSTWVTSAYLTNGGDWATWSYAWNRPSHDSASVSITVEVTDDDGAMGSDTVAATLDSQAPVVSSGVSFDFLPVSGLSAGIDLSSSWSDAHTGTPEFQYTLNGAASGWSDSDAGASEFATKSYPGLPALDGNDLFDSIESRHTDAAGNGPTSSTAGPIYVQPMAPAASTVDNATPTTLDVTINETESGLGILYAIEVDGFQYVQAGGALGGSPVWQTLAAWGSPITLTGLSPETFYLFRTFAGNPSDGTPTPAENSQSTGFGSSSGITTSVIPPSVSVTAPASGSVFGGPAPYTVEGTASDSDGTVVSVRVQIVKGAEYWDPSTETWVGSSTWVTSAYLTNGGDWATWSYAWNRPSHDSASVSITVEVTDDDGAMGSDTVAATLDSQAPVVSSGVSFDFLPVSGLSAGIDLSSSWSDAHTGTPEFQYTLNGAASGWSDSDAGASEFATKSYPGLPALDGNDLFDSIESRHTDAAGNGPTSSTAGPIYVQPMAPAASTVDNATPTTLDVTINETESGLGILYAIEVDGFQYVQAGGALGGSPVWQTLAAWGSPITLTGLSPETFYLFRTFAGNPSDGTPTPAENSQSTGFGSSSGITTSVIPPSVSVTAPASGSVFGGPAPYTVEGTASDSDGTVVSVRVQIVKGAEYWDPSTETWVGSSTWVTSAYLTNGGDWATWSYAWNRPSHDSASVSITVEVTDDDGAMGSDTVAATLDSQAPVVSSGVSFDFLPVSGLSAGIDLSSSWSDAHTGTPEFQYTLNGAASGWSDSDAGASEFATKSYPGLPALDGNDLFDSIESRHTDAAGNGPTSSTAGPIYVQPMAPAASTVDNATPTTLDVTINETESGLGILYAIEVDGFQYVQAGGALGGSPVWQTLAAWGSPITLTGLSPETFYLFRTFAGNPSDGTPTPAENSQSTGFGSSSGITTSVIPPSVSVPAIGPIGLGVLATLMLAMTMRKRR